jgi:hypothetical protein
MNSIINRIRQWRRPPKDARWIADAARAISKKHQHEHTYVNLHQYGIYKYDEDGVHLVSHQPKPCYKGGSVETCTSSD